MLNVMPRLFVWGELMGHRLQRSTEYYQEALVRLQRRRAVRTA
jgi:hypothetical protein